MFERVIVTCAVVAGLGLLWLGWHYYKARAMQAIRPVGVSTGRPNLLYFTGPYCAACKYHQTPIVEAISAKLGDSIAVKQYDVSIHPELTHHYKILTLPTTIIVNRLGEVTHVNYGVTRQDMLETQLLID